MLERTFTLRFVNVLMQLPVTETYMGRGSLLYGLPPFDLRRDQESRRLDLDSLVHQLNMLGRSTGVKPLLIVAQNACSHASGREDLVNILNGMIQQLERYYLREIAEASHRSDQRRSSEEDYPTIISRSSSSGGGKNDKDACENSQPEPFDQFSPDVPLDILPSPSMTSVKMSREEQIDHLYAWGRVKKWTITPEKNAISEEIRVDIGNNYQVLIRGVSHVYPAEPAILTVSFERRRLLQKDINEIITPCLKRKSGYNLYQLVEAIADTYIRS